MGSPLPPLVLAVSAALADGAGAHRAAFYLVLLAIPFAAGAALAAAGDLADGSRAGLRTSCTAVALAFLVLSSAVRSNAPVGGAVPALALSALLACVAAYVMLGLLWAAWPPPVAASAPPLEPAADSYEIAA